MKVFLISIKIILIGLFLMGSISTIAQNSKPKKKKHSAKVSNADTVKGAGYYFDAGNDKAKSGDYVGAIDMYDKSIVMSPNTYDAYYDRAYCKMHLNDYEAAIADFTTSIRLHKGPYSNALYLRGDCFNQLKRYDMAIADFTKALDVSSNPDIYADRGFSYIQKGEFKNALSDYSNAIAKNPDKTELYGQRAICEYRLHHLQEAIDDAKKFLSKQPSSSEIMEVELRAQIEMRDFPSALKTAETFTSVDKSAKAYYYKGLIEVSQMKYQDGATDFTSAIRIDSTYRDAYYSRSLCYHALKDDANACKDLQKARQFGFPNLEAKINDYCRGKKQ